jgi:hypothetical protein
MLGAAAGRFVICCDGRLTSEPAGRALFQKEVRYLLSGPDREKPEGARDARHAPALFTRLGGLLPARLVREMEPRAVDSAVQSQGGREEVWPLPKDVREAVDNYLRLDGKWREIVHSGGADAPLFQPLVNYRTLDFDKPLSTGDGAEDR